MFSTDIELLTIRVCRRIRYVYGYERFHETLTNLCVELCPADTLRQKIIWTHYTDNVEQISQS